MSIVTDHQLVTGFEIEIETDLEVCAFSRILATVVNGTPVHLSRVVVSGTVVYPVLAQAVYEPRTVRTCRFSVRHASTTLDGLAQKAILDRIGERFAWSDLRLITSAVASERLAS